MARAVYFAGLQLKEPRGVSSEDVIFYKMVDSLLSHENKLSIFFLPTVTDQELFVPPPQSIRTRITLQYFSSWSDYIIVTRPFSFTTQEVENIALRIRGNGDYRIVASLASPRLSSLRTLASRFSGKVDGYEIDLGLTYLLTGGKRGFESYAIDMVEEFVSDSSRPVFIKVSPTTPFSHEFLQQLKSIGIAALIFSPHLTYSIGKEFFRIHAPALSRIYALIWAKLIAGTNLPSAYISDIPEQFFGELAVENTFDVLLFDTALLSGVVDPPRTTGLENEIPVRWPHIPELLRPAIDVSRDPHCINLCPYRAFEADSRSQALHTSIIIASEKCNHCGLCLSCKNLKLVANIIPEE
ncbi:MAG: hypothetical protein ABWK01_03205 [Infirmifilum sp.]